MKYNNRNKNKKTLQVKLRTFSLLFFLVFLSACATTTSIEPEIPRTPPVESEAQALWDAFIPEKDVENTPQPYTLNGSLRFGYTNKTHRANYILWGNGGLPLRLDIQAGIGTSIAKIEETQKTLLVYLPQDKKAVLIKGGSDISTLLALGMPIPISFLDLSYLLRGKFSHAFGGIKLKDIDLNEGASVKEKYLFHFENKNLLGSLRLNAESQPVECNINKEWQIFIEYNADKLPYKVTLTSLFEDYKAILLVKNNQKVEEYSKDKLKLVLPENTPIQVNQ